MCSSTGGGDANKANTESLRICFGTLRSLVAMARVLIVEDQPVYLDKAREAFEGHPFFDVRYVATLVEGLAELALHQPHVVVVDVFIPRTPGEVAPRPEYGEELIEVARRQFNPPKVLAWSTDEERAVEYLRRPDAVDDFVVKRRRVWEVGDELLTAVEAITGHWVCSSEVARSVWEELKHFQMPVVALIGPGGCGKTFLSKLLHGLNRHPLASCLRISLAWAEAGDVEAAVQQAMSDCPCATMVLEDFHLIAGLPEGDQLAVSRLIAQAGGDDREDTDYTRQRLENVFGPMVILTSCCDWENVLGDEHVHPRLRRVLQQVNPIDVPSMRERLPEDLGPLLEVFRREANACSGARVEAIHPAAVQAIYEWIEAGGAGDDWGHVKSVIYDGVRLARSGELELRHLELQGLPKRYSLSGLKDGKGFHRRATSVEVAQALDQEGWDLVVEARLSGRIGHVFAARIGDRTVQIENPQLQGILFLLVSHAGEPVDLRLHARSLGIPPRTSFRSYIYRLRQLLGDRARGHESRFIRACKKDRYMLKSDVSVLMVIRKEREPETEDDARRQEG